MNNVWVNGTFDVLHVGHIRLLKLASTFGKVRVGIDSDDRIKKLKGPERPFNTMNVRKEMLESLVYVDSVVIFNDDYSLVNEIKNWNSKTMVIGSDYKNKKIIGGDLFENIIYFDRLSDYSTTKILEFYKNE
jgi:D-beta-D-heptose 7-phosphate kinase/D-beta-D-heptose 1-phosphate adenosyltransferase